MTHRVMPEQMACPVEPDLLVLLLRSPNTRVAEIVDGQEMFQRAALAAFCFQQDHMRDMAIVIAKRCSVASLRASGGSIGELLIEQANVLTKRVPRGRQKRVRT